jgi:protein phosphatase
MSDYQAPPPGDNGDDRESTAKFDRSELVRGWRDIEGRSPRVVPILKVAAKSDMGQVRENNEDKFDFYEPETPGLLAARGSLFAVGDGVGGAQAGQIASELMLKALMASYYDSATPDPVEALHQAILDANGRIFSLAQAMADRNGMGSTLTAAAFIENRVIIGQVGDSRAYLVRDGVAQQVTLDHSLVEEQFRAGVITREEANNSPFKNVITRSMGGSHNVYPDFFEEDVRVGDTWVLCSDGFSNNSNEQEIAEIVSANCPSEAARQFIELANARGGSDNITVLVVAVRDLYYPDPSQAQPAAEAVPHANSTATEPLDPALIPGLNGSNGLASTRESEERPNRSGWRRLFGK